MFMVPILHVDSEMSMERCSRCSRAIDTDQDCECVVQVIAFGDDGAFDDVIMCELCREEKDEAEALEEIGVDL